MLNDGEDEEDDDNDGNNDDEFNDDTDGKNGECHDDGDSLTLFYDLVNIIYISEVYFAGSSYPNSLSAWKTEDMPYFIYVSVTLLSTFHRI